MKYLFPNFLKDLDEFYESQTYLIHLCQKILEKNQQQNRWKIGADPLENDLSVFTSYPIVGGFNVEKTKGFTINQQDPREHTKWEIVAYTAESHKFSDTQPIIYLEFNCNLSEESVNIFIKLFEKWIQPNCDKEEIEKSIKSLDLVNKPSCD